jgi:hypothetical protein
MARKRTTDLTTIASTEGAGAAAAPANKRRAARAKSSAGNQPDAVPEDLSAQSGTAAQQAPPDPAVDREEVERLAHSYWEARGCPEGSAEEDWFRAEQEVRARRAAAAGG